MQLHREGAITAPQKISLDLETKPSAKEMELRKKLIEIYKDAVGKIDLKTLELNQIEDAINQREALATHLLESGDELGSNTVRKSTIKFLLETSEHVGKKASESLTLINESKKKAIDIKAQMQNVEDTLSKLNEKGNKIIENLVEARAAAKDTTEIEKRLDSNKKSVAKNNEELDKLNSEYSKLENEVKDSYTVFKQNYPLSLGLKSAAMQIMLAMKNVNDAINLAQTTLDECHKMNMYGGAASGELLLKNVLKVVFELFNENDKGLAQNTEGNNSMGHTYIELALENALDAANKIEDAVQQGVSANILKEAVEFRLIATEFAMANGNRSEMHKIIDSGVELYESRGYDKSLVAQLLEHGILCEKTFEIKSEIAELQRKDEKSVGKSSITDAGHFGQYL